MKKLNTTFILCIAVCFTAFGIITENKDAFVFSAIFTMCAAVSISGHGKKKDWRSR